MHKMVDCGINYIGDLPSYWHTARLKDVVTTPIKTGAGEEAQAYSPNSIRYIRISDFDKNGNIIEDNAAYIAFEKGRKYLLEKGDLLAATAGATVGKTLLFNGLDEDACYAGYLAKIKVESSVLLTKFLMYQMKSQVMDGFRECYVKKSTIENISASTYSSMPVIIAPIDEQKKIVNYLDHVYDRIEKSIDTHKSVMDKLDEYRAAITIIATTKGITSTELKDSGEEWLGEIPKHWDVRRIWSLFKETNERGSSELPILTVSINDGISDTELSEEESMRNFVRSEDKTKYKRMQPGDIVYNMMRAWQGAFGAARVEGMVSPAYVTARPIVEMDSRYFEYLMRSDTAAQEFEKYSRGIADFRLRLYWPEFKNIKVCYPPVSEQSEIADFLDNIYKKVDEAKAYHSSLINKLEEYRNSVTYNLVTGKMECEEVQNG